MKILVMTAHPDDADVMAGGTIARWIDEGQDVRCVMFTRGDKGHDDPHGELPDVPTRASTSSSRNG